MLKKRKLLVTGGAGFIGSTFVRQAIARGDEVIVLDALTYAGHEENLSSIEGDGQFTFIKGNIGDGKLVSNLLKDHRVDTIVNFAAESHVDNSISSPAVFMDTNIKGVYTLLEAGLQHYRDITHSQRNEFRFVQVSTDEVFGSVETGYFTEESNIRPNSPYSASKASGDLLVRAWHHTYALPTITTHCSNNYGPRQYPEKLIPVMITRALEGRGLPVYGDGKNVRDWIHVEDHCRGIYLAIDKGQAGHTYCFGGRAEKTNIDMVTQLCTLLDEMQPASDKTPYKSLIKFVADRLGHDRRYAIDDSKAEKELGFTRHYDFESGLRQTVAWYLQNATWCQAVMKKAA